MNSKSLQTALQNLPLGGLIYFEHVGSTNDIALKWADEGGRDFSLVIANEQTAGRGRNGRSWQTPPDSALALSLLLLPNNRETKNISLFTGLGALALVTTLEKNYTLKAEIKWPNDILVHGKKLAGILVETSWIGEEIQGIVLGMGVNIHSSAIPTKANLHFPATPAVPPPNKPIRSSQPQISIFSPTHASFSSAGSFGGTTTGSPGEGAGFASGSGIHAIRTRSPPGASVLR